MVFPMKRLLICCLLLTIEAGVCQAADGTLESSRVRQMTLDTLITTKRALLKSKWLYLGQVEAQIRDLSPADPNGPPDGDVPGPERLAEMVRKVTRLEMLEAERLRTLQAMQEINAEVLSLQAELDRVKSDRDRAQQVMEGRWVLNIMPMGTRGEVYLTQNGTLLIGEYHLENEQSGSLQGIFVNNQMVLERIDAKFGKMGRFEGPLGRDRQSVRGTWYSYDLSSGQPATGPFTLDKVQEDRTP
jgi:hypothetical protein